MSGAKRRWTAAEEAAVSRWQYEGVPQAEQARRLGRTRCAVKCLVIARGLAGHAYHARGADARARLLALLARGLTPTAAAPIVPCSAWTARRLAREFGRRGLVRKLGRYGPYRLTARWAAAD